MAISDMFGKKKEEPIRIPLSGAQREVASPAPTMPSDEEMLARIKSAIDENKVALFMKGTPEAPMCGFSAAVVDILNQSNVRYVGINAIENPRFRNVLSTYSSWPTLPQLFVNGKLVGGCDIVREMKASGELHRILEKAR